jgi:hypothetical protein
MSKGESTIFLKDWRVLIRSLNEEDQLYFWSLFMEYPNSDECNRSSVLPVWLFIKQQLDRMREAYELKCQKNRQNGSRGGRPSKRTEKNPSVTNGADGNRLRASVSLNKNENENKKDNKNERVMSRASSLPFNSIKFQQAWDRWLQYLHSRGKMHSPASEELSLKELQSLAKSAQEAILILEQSQSRNWIGLFELKNRPDSLAKIAPAMRVR